MVLSFLPEYNMLLHDLDQSMHHAKYYQVAIGYSWMSVAYISTNVEF
jgi:hypothetical protein